MMAVEERLSTMYSNISPEQISAAIQNALARFEQSAIRDFVPLFVERRAREQLAGGGQLASAGR